MLLVLHYKNGADIIQKINYIHQSETHLIFTRKRNPAPVFQDVIRIPIENLAAWNVYQED